MSRRTYWFLLILILTLAATLRLVQITTVPPGFHFDEAFEGLEAWRILTDPTYRPIFLTGNFGVPPLNAYINALTFGLFQLASSAPGPTAMRVTAACLGIMTVFVLFLLANELRRLEARERQFSLAFPLFAAAVLAVMRWHIHFSRMGIEPIFVPLVWTVATWLLLVGWRTGSYLHFAGCGVALAAGMYAYQGAWVIPFLMVAMSVYLAVGRSRDQRSRDQRLETRDQRLETRDQRLETRDQRLETRDQRLETRDQRLETRDQRLETRDQKPETREYATTRRRDHATTRPHDDATTRPRDKQRLFLGLAFGAGVALLLVAPLFWFFWQNPALALLRPTQLAIVGDTGSPADDSVWHSVAATAKMFGPLGAPGDQDPRRNIPGAPALNGWLVLPFYLGLLLALWRCGRPAYAIVWTGLVGLLLPGIFSEYAPHFHRILGAAAPTALLCGLGLDWFWQRRLARMAWGRWVAILLLLAGAVTDVRDYFGRWASLPELFYAFDVGLWRVGQEIATQPADRPVYLTPRSADHPTLAFAWEMHPGKWSAPIAFDGRHIFPLTDQAAPLPELYAVIEHEDFRTPLLLPGVLPTALIQQEILDGAGEVYARFYQRPANSVAVRPPQQPLAVAIGDGVRLLGYDVQPTPLHPGQVLYLQLHWLVEATPAADWTVFTHLLATDAAGKISVVAGHDSRPGEGSLPTLRWQPGWRILDEYQIALPADLAPGDYGLEMGLYRPTGEHLPAATGVVLGKVHLE